MSGIPYELTREEAEAALLATTPQEVNVNLNLDLSDGVVRSSKEMFLSGYSIPFDKDSSEGRTFSIFHGIDGTVVDFTYEQAIEVLMGTRDPWDGEVQPDLEDKARRIVDKVMTVLWMQVPYGTEFRDMDEGTQERIFDDLSTAVEEMLYAGEEG
jgi:hypothetical protein